LHIGLDIKAEQVVQVEVEKDLITLLKDLMLDKSHKLELTDLVAAEAALGQTEVEME
tara:strand:- start:188 stop:358 length:171 start_codon:yes stop_codon:yes gene_type:complete